MASIHTDDNLARMCFLFPSSVLFHFLFIHKQVEPVEDAPGQFPLQMYQVCPPGQKPWGRPKRDFSSQVYLGTFNDLSQEELKSVAGNRGV